MAFNGKRRGTPSVEVDDSWSQPPSSISSSDESYCRNHHHKHRKASAPMMRDQAGKVKPKYWHSFSGSDRDTGKTSSGNGSHILNLSGNTRPGELLQLLVIATEQKLPAIQTINQHYSQVFDYRTYLLANCSFWYEKTVSSYISRMIERVKLQIKTHFFNPGDSISSVGSLATFKLARNTNHALEGAAVWVRPFFLKTLLLKR